MDVYRWELWSGTDDDGTATDTFVREDTDLERQIAIAGDFTLTWSTFAEGTDDATMALHISVGWEEYRPILQAGGTPYPEDEADEDVVE